MRMGGDLSMTYGGRRRSTSGVSGVWGDDDTEYGGAPAWTGTGGGIGFGGDVDGGCCDFEAKTGVGAVTPVW